MPSRDPFDRSPYLKGVRAEPAHLETDTPLDGFNSDRVQASYRVAAFFFLAPITIGLCVAAGGLDTSGPRVSPR